MKKIKLQVSAHAPMRSLDFYGDIRVGEIFIMLDPADKWKKLVGVPMIKMRSDRFQRLDDWNAKFTKDEKIGMCYVVHINCEPVANKDALVTVQAVKEALVEYRSDQLEVILQMADNRELDRDALSLQDYKALINEEAEFSLQISNGEKDDKHPDRDEQQYGRDLRKIANRIVFIIDE